MTLGGLALALLTASCAHADALALARHACAHVARSISDYERSQHTTDPAKSTALAQQALAELRAGLPDAAIAAGEDAGFQALMTTMQEGGQVPESDLVDALRSQCAAVAAPGGGGT